MEENLKKQVGLLYEEDCHEDILVLLKKEFGEDFFAWDHDALGRYAVSCCKLERYDEAIEALNISSAKDESDWKWYYRKMYAHFGRIKENDEIDEDIAKVLLYSEHLLKINEDRPLGQEYLELVNYARYYTLLLEDGEEAAGKFAKEHNYLPPCDITYYTEEEIDAVQKYYDTEFGKSENVFHEIASEVFHCDIVNIPPDDMNKCYTLCTMGAGAITMNAVTDEMRDDYGR